MIFTAEAGGLTPDRKEIRKPSKRLADRRCGFNFPNF
jgi:hypothetical protein